MGIKFKKLPRDDGWRNVELPTSDLDWVPFTIQRNGDRFRPHPSFDLQTYAGITVAKTYYVDSVNGSNGNTGLDWDNAFETIDHAWSRSDVDRVYIRDSYFFLADCNTEPTRDVETIGIGEVIFSSNVRNDAGAFSLVDNHYEGDFSSYRYIASVYDEAYLDSYGLPRGLTARASIALVDANPNSFFFDYQGHASNTLYIRTYDSRAPDTDLRYHESGPFIRNGDNQTLYFENITFQNSATIRNNSAAGGMKAYFKNCKMSKLSVGGADVIVQNINVEKGEFSGGDGININVRNTVIARVIEIDSLIRYAPAGAGSDQCSTGHAASEIVRINGEYYLWGGQIIADVTGCITWMLGVNLHDSQTDVAVYMEGNAWLDRCFLGGDLTQAGAYTVHVRGCTITGAQSGTIEPY